MAEVPSGGSYVVVAQEQEWNKIQLPDGREGWVHRFYMGQTPSAPEQPPSQTAPVVTPPPAIPSSAVATGGHAQSRGQDRHRPTYVTPHRSALGPGLRYEVMAEVPSGGSYVVVAQEQEWNKIQLPDGREGWVHRFYMGQTPSAPEQPPSQTAPWLLHRRPYHPPRLPHRRSRPVL